MLARRQVLQGLMGLGFAAMAVAPKGRAAGHAYEVTLSADEWRRRLTPEQFAVLREAGTERAFTSALLHEKRDGTFTCAGCARDLFSSKTKYDSGTGWPSFWAALPGSVEESVDHAFGMTRTEVRCQRCGGHLGHVFDDGPRPTGLRYCMNGVALGFRPAQG